MSEARRQRLWQLGAAAVFAVAVVVVVVVVSQAGSSSLQDLPGDQRAAAGLFRGIPQRGTVLGSPNAPATLVEYADLQCPFCRSFTLDSLPTILEDYVRPGRLQLRFEPQTFIGADSQPAARLALAASLQNRLWQLTDVLYRNQEEENSGYVTDEFLRKVAGATPGLDSRRALTAQDSGKVTELLDRSRRAFAEAGLSSTPSFEIEQEGKLSPLAIADSGDPSEFTSRLDSLP